MSLQFLLDAFQENSEKQAIIWRDQSYTYAWMLQAYQDWLKYLEQKNLPASKIVVLEADFSPSAVVLLLALLERGCIVVPLTASSTPNKDNLCEIAEAELRLKLISEKELKFEDCKRSAAHPLYAELKKLGHAGLVYFSSGSSGKSKATLLDFDRVLDKFRVRRPARRCIPFLLFDHFGGMNTLLYSLSGAGCLVIVEDRSPHTVLAAVEKHKVELLPTSPTFLNLVLVSGAYQNFDLSSLRMVSYGTEPMPQSTLDNFHRLFPKIELLQTYGLTEVGVLRSRSKNSESLWVKVGGEGYQTRVVDGLLEIKSHSTMLGYLNAENPFTADGWFQTGDAVEVDGEYMKILGRKSELINVGGQKVFPAEVESVIKQFPGVVDATVFGEKNNLFGQAVCALVSYQQGLDQKTLTPDLIRYCRQNLPSFKVPIRIKAVEASLHSERFKKIRSPEELSLFLRE